MKYYTYAYLREDGTPYYIGKGTGKRAKRRHYRGIRSITPPTERILYLKYFTVEADALAHEKYMIYVLGRIDNNTGILRNLTDGGDGTSGYIYSKEHKTKLSAIAKIREEVGYDPRTKTWEFINPQGEHIIVEKLGKFCKENGLDKSSMVKVGSGKRNQHKGYTNLHTRNKPFSKANFYVEKYARTV